MAFTLPDNDEAFNANQATWMQTDIDALVAGIGGVGVMSGCAVTAQASPDMSVVIAPGTIQTNTGHVLVSAGVVSLTPAHATLPRLDLIVVNSSGVKNVVTGTAATYPKAFDIPANNILLAIIFVPATSTAITSVLITDKRVFCNNPLDSHLKFIPKASGWTRIAVAPGWNSAGTQATVTLTASRLYYIPFVIEDALTIDGAAIIVQTASAGQINMGLVGLDEWGQPTNQTYANFGTVDTGTTGAKIATISAVTLQRGRYAGMLLANGTPVLRIPGSNTLVLSIMPPGEPSSTAITMISTMHRAYTYTAAAFGDMSGQPWTNANTSSAGFQMMMWLMRSI